MTNLTIIIPFLNEGNEVENTVVSVRETATTNPTILLINDDSDDGYDYESIAERYNCRYIKNEKREGSAPSKDKGVALSETPYFVLLDGHMRLYEKGWDERIERLITENPRSLLCGQSKRLTRDEDGNVVDEEKASVSYGAYINMEYGGPMDMKWNYKDISPHSDLAEIPCVLGAAYACRKEYWQYLQGYKGLMCYGLEEQLISIKVWMEGGQCLLVKDWVAGHLYRKAFPYEAPAMEMLYNRLFLLELLFPYPIKNDFFASYKSILSTEFDKVYALLKSNFKEIKTIKNSLNSIFKNPIEYFLEKNEKLKSFN